jgi:hypothetical protein
VHSETLPSAICASLEEWIDPATQKNRKP